MKGKFKPKFPEKYIGNTKRIIYRSSYEFKAFMSLDHDPSVVKWASEEFFIPYISPIDNRPHRYFIDLYVQRINEKNVIEHSVIEIKPLSQTNPPIPPKKVTVATKRRYLKEMAVYAINIAKWKSAKKWADKKGFTFQIMTERELKIPAYHS